jgi:Flp pilus assembly protein TadB
MRFGALEIGIIVVIIIIIFGINRFMKIGQNSSPRVYEREEEPATKTRSVTRRITREEADEKNIKRNRSARARILGLILICVGVLIILYGFFILRWVAMSSLWLWAVVLVAIGLATLFITRRR